MTNDPTHLGDGSTIMVCARWVVVLIAVNRHEPQQMWPHGVSVALIGGQKHMGHVYAEKGSRDGVGAGVGVGDAW